MSTRTLYFVLYVTHSFIEFLLIVQSFQSLFVMINSVKTQQHIAVFLHVHKIRKKQTNYKKVTQQVAATLSKLLS